MKIDIFDIQRFSTGDGRGIRTTVFFNGCNLRCPWCHNPESIYGCTALACDNMQLCGFVDADDILKEALSDIEFYERSGGGVTLSGGEPLLQESGCVYLLQKLQIEKIDTVIDTALAVDGVNLKELAGLGCSFIVDIKTADKQMFAKKCGGNLDIVIKNLNTLAELEADVVLRIPLIPSFNMDDASIDAIIKFIAPYKMPISLLPFHRLGSAKYKTLGIEYEYASVKPPDSREIELIKQRFLSNGIVEADI